MDRNTRYGENLSTEMPSSHPRGQRPRFNVFHFLTHSHPTSPKHTSENSAHGILATIVHHVLSIAVIVGVHDNLLFSSFLAQRQERRQQQHHEQQYSMESNFDATDINDITAYALVAYYCIIFFLRHRNAMTRNIVFYQTMWLCNTTLLVGSFCFKTRRDTMALGYMIAVCIDQVLWYVDLSVWIISGRKTFPIGVAKYLTWPSTQWHTRFTSTHHLWTMPVFLRAYFRSSHHDHEMMSANVMMRCFALSCVVVTMHVILARWLTPNSIVIVCNGRDDNDGNYGKIQEGRQEYLNVNLSHELWKDISFSFLQISKDDPSPIVYIARLLWRWWMFNAIVFFGLLLPTTNFFIEYLGIL